jgi:hypothetical protein
MKIRKFLEKFLENIEDMENFPAQTEFFHA